MPSGGGADAAEKRIGPRMTVKDIMALIGTGFSLACLGFIVWILLASIREAKRQRDEREAVRAQLHRMIRGTELIHANSSTSFRERVN